MKKHTKYDIIHTMRIAINTIFEFHHMRTTAHVECLNYFAGLLGYHFPEHDNDKNIDTMKTAYAYINYHKYHPEYNISNANRDLFKQMHTEHHRMQPHHLEHYSDVSEINDITLIEMICDWHSANFEQRYLTHEDKHDYTVQKFFETHLLNNPKYNWASHQINLIYETIDFLDMYANYEEIMKIWRPLLNF